jgi:hypothetical protein
VIKGRQVIFFFREETDDPREVQEYSYSQSG